MQPPKYSGFGKTMIMARYNKLDSEIIALGDGENPPAERINPDYKQQPSNPRKCVECGKTHDIILENTMTGERIEELSKCKDCLAAAYSLDLSENLKEVK